MTGYGKSDIQTNDKVISIEIKSLNSKYLDVGMRLPSCLRSKELELRKMIGASLVRGKIDLLITINHLKDSDSNHLNKAVIRSYMDELKTISNADEVALLKIAVRFPDVLAGVEVSFTPEEWKVIEEGVSSVIAQLNQYRVDEGISIQKDLKTRVGHIYNLLLKMSEIAPERQVLFKNKLRKKVEELQIAIDDNRFEQELIYYIEKIDINEEEVRLANHLNYFEETLDVKSDENGKKLNFIAQEIGREINTLGSKSNHAVMQQCVVQMKEELEKIKEQTLNIL